MNIIDGHCHILKGELDSLLREMDDGGVERAVICPSRPCIAVSNREGNETLAAAQSAHPDRFAGFAVANPWCGAKAAEELKHARDLGLHGLKVNSAIQGFSLLDPMFFPLIEFARDAKWPVYCHMGTPVHALPLQLAELAGLYPDVTFILGHCGFSDFWNDIPDAITRCPKVYLETSYAYPSQLEAYLKSAGPDRIIFGSDRPFSSLGWEIEKTKASGLDDAARESVFSGNMERILGGAA